jgi:hypothetical protein
MVGNLSRAFGCDRYVWHLQVSCRGSDLFSGQTRIREYASAELIDAGGVYLFLFLTCNFFFPYVLGSSGALPGRREGPKENGTGGNQTRAFGHDRIHGIWSTRVRLETWCRRRDSILLLPHNRDASEHVRLDSRCRWYSITA